LRSKDELATYNDKLKVYNQLRGAVSAENRSNA
jgi:hypothetical protein